MCSAFAGVCSVGKGRGGRQGQDAPAPGIVRHEVDNERLLGHRLAHFGQFDLPGAGAAGGLGAGLMAFAGSKVRSGIDMVCDVLDFDSHLEGASLVITGEGGADRSTIFDKAPVGVARRALAKGVPTILLAGTLGQGHEELYDHGIAGILSIADRPMSFDQSLRRTGELLEAAAHRAMRLIGVGRGMVG